MDDNNMYQNQTEQNHTEGAGQGMPPVQNNGSDGYGNHNYAGNAYADNQNQSNGYGNNGYTGNAYYDQPSNGGYVSGGANGYTNNNYNGGTYNDGYTNYNNGYQPYPASPYLDNQPELEEPVKISEWVLSMVLMMIPCVNIIFMFVFAFSKSEKKSKSNFFKAYLIVFGVMLALMLVLWVFGIYAILSFVD